MTILGLTRERSPAAAGVENTGQRVERVRKASITRLINSTDLPGEQIGTIRQWMAQDELMREHARSPG